MQERLRLPGVLKETTHKSHIVFDALASMSTIEQLHGPISSEFRDFTNNFNHWTYLLLKPGMSAPSIQKHLDAIYKQHVAGITNPDVQKMSYSLQAMNEIASRSVY
jgi:putative ABC transport system permease protein